MRNKKNHLNMLHGCSFAEIHARHLKKGVFKNELDFYAGNYYEPRLMHLKTHDIIHHSIFYKVHSEINFAKESVFNMDETSIYLDYLKSKKASSTALTNLTTKKSIKAYNTILQIEFWTQKKMEQWFNKFKMKING
ncbi:hypothetical protein BpHYR1_014062 [Brachionus plicatilis]|uniref:Uncharacterized protein n=1 Tax=Brachionus plicatilis TaxID=10195 RepID=A0A3M7S176_BRAPC|nr:hypothetical protein BpHYR1_014062 [Brachionus plicatilis]